MEFLKLGQLKKDNLNIFHLYFQNSLNLLFPLLLILYIIPIIGSTNYGNIIYYYSITSSFAIITDLGFDTLGINIIGKYDKLFLRERILLNISFLKTIFLFFLFIGSLFFIELNFIYFCSLWIPIFSILLPSWYYIGNSQFKKFSILSLVNKLILILFLLILIKSQSDFVFIPMIFLISCLVVGIISFYWNRNILQAKISFRLIKYLVRYSFKFYLSTSLMQLIKISPKFILGKYGLFDYVGFYDIAEKFINILKIPNLIISKFILSKVSSVFDINLIKYNAYRSIIINTVLLVIFNVFLKDILYTFSITQENILEETIRVLSVGVFVIMFNNICGQQVLIPLGQIDKFYRSILNGVFLYIPILIVIDYFSSFTPVTFSYSIVLIEFIILLSQANYIYTNENIKNRIFSRRTI